MGSWPLPYPTRDEVRTAYPHGAESVLAIPDAAFTTLAAEVSVLRQEVVAEVRRRLAADSTTSSKSPSADRSRAMRHMSLRTSNGWRPGG